MRFLIAASDRLPWWVRALLSALCPALATLAANAPPHIATTNAAMVYVLSVVLAALIGGVSGGLIASLLSFLGLNFFFTPPFNTLLVQKGDDVVALVVFFFVSALIATLIRHAIDQRVRAEKRESESRLLYRLSSRLLGRDNLSLVLNEFVKDMVDLFGLSRCEVMIDDGHGGKVISSAGQASAGSVLELDLATEHGRFGIVRIFSKEGEALGVEQVTPVKAFVSQLALALESAKLDREGQEARAEAEASRIRAALFSSVTHDLKTPLSSIKASATSLLDGDVQFDDNQKRELLSTVVEESDRLNRLIGNLIDLSRVRAGALVPNKTPALIDEVIEGVVARLQKLMVGREVRVRVRERVPAVPMDVLQIDQAISNLLENVLKHTPEGTPVEISAAAFRTDLEVKVADRGPGVPPEERAEVFKEFYRAEAGDSRGGGSGLGLAIARAIVEAHGGAIWVTETPGGGATFGFRIPLGSGNA